MKNLNTIGKTFYVLTLLVFLITVANFGTFGVLFYLLFNLTMGALSIFVWFACLIVSGLSFATLLKLETV
jgi:hypothetical protein